MADETFQLITPEERLRRAPFAPSNTSAKQHFKNIRLENYSQLPLVDLEMPAMDHHVLIYNYKPPSSEVRLRCGGVHYKGVWQSQMLSLVPAFQDNRWLIPEPQSGSLHILFPHEAVRKVIEETANLSPDSLELQSLFQSDDPVLKHLCELILGEVSADFSSGNLYMESLANASIVHLLNRYSNKAVTDREDGKINRSGLQKLVEYIDQNLAEKISLDRLAEILNMSSYHFSRSFKASTGYTPHQFVLMRRTYKARELLLDKRLTPAQISQLTGFSDQSHLNKQLRRLFNLTAKQIRA